MTQPMCLHFHQMYAWFLCVHVLPYVPKWGFFWLKQHNDCTVLPDFTPCTVLRWFYPCTVFRRFWPSTIFFTNFDPLYHFFAKFYPPVSFFCSILPPVPFFQDTLYFLKTPLYQNRDFCYRPCSKIAIFYPLYQNRDYSIHPPSHAKMGISYPSTFF